MSKYIDEDDFYDEEQDLDYEDPEFIEEELSPEEISQLTTLFPVIKSHFQNYNNKDITDEVLKKTLWLNYFELDDSIDEIKANYKKIPKTAKIGGTSKLAQLLLKRLLLKRQKEEEEAKNGNKLISILDKLSSSPSSPITLIPTTEVPKVSTGKRRRRRRIKPEVVVQPPTIIEEKIKKPDDIIKPIDYNSSLLIENQTSFTKLMTVPPKKRKLNNHEILKPIYTNNSIIVKKITTNFTKPSPDDVILTAQANLFNDIDKNLAKIDISKTETTKKLKKNQKIDISKELKNFKPQSSFVIFGHVDSGKSTIIGRMLYDLKIVDSKTLHKLQQESDKIGKGSFALAWIMDQTEDERSRGVTVDIVNTTIDTETHKLNIIDSPGHQDFVPQLINGIAQADVGVLIIDCNDFESGFLNIQEQVLISKNLGIDELIIALNKFDLMNYDVHQLDHIIEILTIHLTKIGYVAENLKFVPVSGLIGDNIVKPSQNFQWKQTLVESFHETIENSTARSSSISDEPFIMTINEIIEGNNVKELRVNGRVNSGYACNGDEFQTFPNKAVVKLDNQQIIKKGDFINNLKFKTSDNLDLLSNGDLITNDVSNFETGKQINVDLKLFEMNKPLLVGTSFVLFHNCKQYASKIVKIESVKKNNEFKTYKKKHLVSLNEAKVVIELDQPLSFNKQNDKLTRVVLRKDGSIIGCGIIL